MKKYIELEAAKEAARRAECDANYDGARFTAEWVENALDFTPTADVVEVDVKDLRVKRAIQTLCEFYSTAKKSDYVQKPLAWALYQTWKSFDKMDGGNGGG